MSRLFRRLLVLAAVLAWAGRVAGAPDGRVLLGELNCTACHAAGGVPAAWITPKAAPRLEELATRVDPEWVRRFLASPRAVLPGTTMPEVLRALPEGERTEAADALRHYLVSLGKPGFKRILPDRGAVARGEILFHRVGCVACHDPRDPATNPVSSVPLPDLAAKWSHEGLRRFLLDPLAIRPSGRMPSLGLSEREASDIAHYLLRETRVPATVEVAQIRGRFRALEDLDAAEIVSSAPAAGFSLDQPGLDRGSPQRFTGWVRVDREVEYTFHFAATGAARLAIDGDWVAGDDSWETEKVDGKARRALGVGRHELKVEFVRRGPREPSIKLEWEAPGMPREPIPASRLSAERDPAPEGVPFAVDAAKAARGKDLYNRLECAACHEGRAPAATPALAALRTDRGCLAEVPPAKAPDFRLEGEARGSLRTALAFLKAADTVPPTPAQSIAHALATFRCTACHTRDGAGGVPADRDAWFTSNGEDLGDEGRIPPRLDGVGDRLRPEWLKEVLGPGAPVRAYMNTRMPRFGAANVGRLADLFVAVDRQARAVPPAPDSPDVQREAGRRLVGTDGLSCIACHRFNRQPGHTMQVVDLATATRRLNEDWFRRFLLDPGRTHPATRMPSFWPEGVSVIPAVLDGDTGRQHAALWTYLSGAATAKFPEGLSRQDRELVVGGEAVVYRGKLWEAGFRAVATGYPGQVNAAFDAEELRLALLWRGRFLDAGAHWGVQGMGRIRPLGTDVVVFPRGSAFAVLASPEAPWPAEPGKELGMKFRGYQLDAARRPTLLYSFRNAAIEDFSEPLADSPKGGLRRVLTFLVPPPDGLHFRVAVGRLIPAGATAWRLGDFPTITMKSGGTPFVRGTGENQELLVPIRADGKNHRVEVDYVW